MQYKKSGRIGLDISPVCIDCMVRAEMPTFGIEESTVRAAKSHALVISTKG